MKKIGIDVGGTTVKGALLDVDEIIKERSAPTRGREGREAIFSAIFTVIDGLFEKGVPIGISSAGNIDPATGKCVYATDNLMGWTGADVAGTVSARYGVPCRADNDAVCALKGELKFYPDLQNATMLTFGTGVGGASLVNGQILRGKNFDAARWGHVTLYPNGRACSCGKKGCAEAYLSATALVSRAQEKGLNVSCKELFAEYEAGNGKAVEVLKAFAEELCILLGTIRTAIAPELIILGGGVMQSEEIVRKLLGNPSDIAFAKLGNRAGIYGAVSEG